MMGEGAPGADTVIRPQGLVACALSRFAECSEYAGGLGNVASRGVGCGAGDRGRMALLAQPLIPAVPLDWVGSVGGCCWSILIESRFGWAGFLTRSGMVCGR